MPTLGDEVITSTATGDIPVPTGTPNLAGATSDDPPVTPTVTPGSFIAATTTSINRASVSADLAMSFGSGGFAIGSGLEISIGSGLFVDLTEGIATIGGIVDVTATSIAIPPSTTDVYLWLLQNGSIDQVVGDPTPPITNCVYLGKCTSNVSSVTAIDTSGVIRWKSSMLYRETADIWKPVDSPDTSVSIITKTAGGTFFWNGEEWLEIVPAGSPKWMYYEINYDDVNIASTTNAYTLITLPVGSIVHATKIKVLTSFAGVSITDVKVKLGITGTDTLFVASFDVDTSGNNVTTTVQVLSQSADENIIVTFTSTGANLANLTTGKIGVWLLYSVVN